MQKRRLGNTDIEVSVLGLGTVKFGRNQGVKYPHAFNLPSDEEIKTLLAMAKECGINLLDTAPAYGTSEERLGACLKDRHDWVISTKVGEMFENGESQFDFSHHGIRESVERSLKRLRTDYLDIVLVHSNGEDIDLIQDDCVFDVLNDLKKEGKLRSYGMSTKTIAGGLKTIEHADVAMVTYNPSYTDEKEIIHAAQQKGKGIFIKKAMGSGHLPATQSLQFALQHPGVTSVIIGTLSPEHLSENVKGVKSR